MIALEHLHVVNVIHQEGSFRKASERLFKARSAVSYSVKQVEEYYQIEIFNRETYRPELTRNGKILLQKIQHLLNEANEFDMFAKQMSSEVETELRLSFSAIFPMEKVTQLLSELKQSFPSTIIHLNIETASGERMLLDDVVDIGIYSVLERSQQVKYRCIEQCELPVFISNTFPLADQPVITLSDLLAYPQVVVKSSYKSGPDSGIMKDGLQWYVSDHNTKKALIHSGLGWGRLALHEAEQESQSNSLIKLDNLPVMTVPVYVAKLNSKALGPVGMMVWNFFESHSG
ncbi:LysR family transcriptional regulator [Photobacterium jeanii]|uniref:LysR family transcriptional regulator n=1 Tax=Photobacterium jeanii TaxID=858640 RepID=A0A178K8P2_9GAMM|nr:LysR family transcriptional regulator [Photobacterium jeanii]OAN13104.1 LysR family transcriptional regulator [Photobacterium jeanii]PST89254.1 LysR family transcriptional regulator [Photobacterium jeanii]